MRFPALLVAVAWFVIPTFLLARANQNNTQTAGTNPGYTITTPSLQEQAEYLDSLLPPGKSSDVVKPLLLSSAENQVNERTLCSGSSTGTATPVGDSGSYTTNASTDEVCKLVHDEHNETLLSFPNPSAHEVHILFIDCTSGYSGKQKATAVATLGYGALFEHKHTCFMQEGPQLSIVLSREKKSTSYMLELSQRSARSRKFPNS
jgi:hypothetical protein